MNRWNFLAAAFLLGFGAVVFGATDSAVPPNAFAESIGEVVLRDVQPYAVQAIRHHEQRRVAQRAPSNAVLPDTFVPSASASGVAPPAPIAGFRTSWETEYAYPSDAGGAVGPKHVLSVSNALYMVSDRQGKALWSGDGFAFWGAASQGGDLYDARAAYDEGADRWVIVSLFDRNVRGSSTMLIAVSATGDPTGKWSRFTIPVSTNPDVFDDFTRLALTRDAIVITANEIAPLVIAADIYIAKKSDAYASSPTTLPLARTSYITNDLIPVTVHGNDGVIRILAADSGIAILEMQNGNPVVVGGSSTLTNFDFGAYLPVSQAGSTTPVAIGPAAVHYAVERNGAIWIVQSAFEHQPERGVVRCFRVSLPLSQNSSVTLFEIQDPSARIHYGFPSLDVNARGAVLIGYSTFSPDQFPSAGYSYIDPAGILSRPGLLKSGEAATTVDRWADFSTTVVDPVDDTTFWTVQTYGQPTQPGIHLINPWAIWWGEIAPLPERHRTVRH